MFKTEHKENRTSAALKQVTIADDVDIDDYSVEISILNDCKHKNIVGLHEAYVYDGRLWVIH